MPQTLATAPGASKIRTKEKKEGIDLNWIWIQSKKKAATDTAMRLLVAFLAGLTFIAVIALFAVWTSVCTIEAAVGRKLRSLKEPYQWFVVPEVKRSKDAIDGQMCRASQVGFASVT